MRFDFFHTKINSYKSITESIAKVWSDLLLMSQWIFPSLHRQRYL